MIARTQDGLLLAARLLLAAALLPTGIARALNVSGFALTLAGSGVPMPNMLATLAVVVQVFGPLALLAGVMPRVAGPLLAAFAVATGVLLHPFWLYAGAAALAERTLLLADLGLAGGYLLYAIVGPGAFSWQGWRAGAFARPPARGEGRSTPKPVAKPAARRKPASRGATRAAA